MAVVETGFIAMGSILDSQDQKDLQEDQPDFMATSGPLYHRGHLCTLESLVERPWFSKLHAPESPAAPVKSTEHCLHPVQGVWLPRAGVWT